MKEDEIIAGIEKQIDKYEVASWDYEDLVSDIEFFIHNVVLKDTLSTFLFHLNEKGLINDFDFDYQEEVEKYLKEL